MRNFGIIAVIVNAFYFIRRWYLNRNYSNARTVQNLIQENEHLGQSLQRQNHATNFSFVPYFSNVSNIHDFPGYSLENEPNYHYFLCPITHTIFIDPVMALDGNFYERQALQRWYDEGHRKCPLIPSRTLTNPSFFSTEHGILTLLNIWAEEKIKLFLSKIEVPSKQQEFSSKNMRNIILESADFKTESFSEENKANIGLLDENRDVTISNSSSVTALSCPLVADGFARPAFVASNDAALANGSAAVQLVCFASQVLPSSGLLSSVTSSSVEENIKKVEFQINAQTKNKFCIAGKITASGALFQYGLYKAFDRAMDGERALDRPALTGEAGNASSGCKVSCETPSSSLFAVTGVSQDESRIDSSPGKGVDFRQEGENLSRPSGLVETESAENFFEYSLRAKL